MKNIVVLIDSRERSNKWITDYYNKHRIKYEVMALPAGDYSFRVDAIPELGIDYPLFFYNDLMLERKNSLEELSGCFTQTRERFNDEWSRCYADRKYLLIENASYDDIVEGRYNTQYNKKSYLSSLHSFETKYDIHVVFMKDRNYTPIYILGLFQYYLRHVIK